VTLVRNWLASLPAYLWGGWGAIASLMLFLAAWEWASVHYGALILPDPRTAFATLAGLLADGSAWPELAATARRALTGFGLALVAGSLLGLAAGVSMTASMMSRPIVTVLIGTPPIAWLVLALLWFGAGDGTPVFTVFVACLPVIFLGAMQGARTSTGTCAIWPGSSVCRRGCASPTWWLHMSCPISFRPGSPRWAFPGRWS
jgi:NitT/TauT family transport system permease protein